MPLWGRTNRQCSNEQRPGEGNYDGIGKGQEAKPGDETNTADYSEPGASGLGLETVDADQGEPPGTPNDKRDRQEHEKPPNE